MHNLASPRASGTTIRDHTSTPAASPAGGASTGEEEAKGCDAGKSESPEITKKEETATPTQQKAPKAPKAPKPIRVDKNWVQYRWLYTPVRAMNTWRSHSFTVPEARGYTELLIDYGKGGKMQFRESSQSRVTISDVVNLLNAAMSGTNPAARRGARTVRDRGVVSVSAGLHAMNPNFRDAGAHLCSAARWPLSAVIVPARVPCCDCCACPCNTTVLES